MSECHFVIVELWVIHRKIDLPIKPVTYMFFPYHSIYLPTYELKHSTPNRYCLSLHMVVDVEETNCTKIQIDWHYNYEEGFCDEWVFSLNFANPLSKYSISKNHLQVFKARSPIVSHHLLTYKQTSKVGGLVHRFCFLQILFPL